jgi:flagellar M-ring protein FliF
MSTLDASVDFIRRVGAPRFVGVLIVMAAGLAGLWGLVQWGTAPEYVPIVQNVPMDVIAAAKQAMDDEGIPSEYSATGTAVLVSRDDVARARVKLAERGVNMGERPGFELFDEPSWGMTDFTQRINYRRALEGELERSIGQMRGISSAQVHIAMSEGSVYQRKDQPVEASVLLRVASGARPAAEQVEAIVFLIASAVDGLTSESVSVLDDAGRVLSAAAEPNSSGRLDRRRMDMQLELEDYLEGRATELLEPVVGPANVRVRVSAQLDFDQVERRTTAVDPNEQVLTGEQRSEIEPGSPEQGAASTIQHNTFDVTRSTEISTRMPGAIKRLTVAVALNESLPSAADPAMISRIQQLVTNAVGIDNSRGDAISVIAVPFAPISQSLEVDSSPTTGPLDVVREFQRPILMIFALILAFVLIMRGLNFARTALPDAAPALPSGRFAQASVAGGGSPLGVSEGANETIVGGPIDASRVVRAWLGEG